MRFALIMINSNKSSQIQTQLQSIPNSIHVKSSQILDLDLIGIGFGAYLL